MLVDQMKSLTLEVTRQQIQLSYRKKEQKKVKRVEPTHKGKRVDVYA